MCVIVPCRAQFSAKLFVRVSYEDTPPEVRSQPLLLQLSLLAVVKIL